MEQLLAGIFVIVAVSFLTVKLTEHFRKERFELKQAAIRNHRNFETAKECLNFFGVELPKGYVAYHKNGEKKDNRFCNLEVITRAEMLRRNLNGKHS